jgi:hypothetical protein
MLDRYHRHICYYKPMALLQSLMRIRDPVHFRSMDPGSVSGIRDGKNRYQSQDSGSGMNIPDPIFENLVSVFWVEITLMRIRIWDPGSCQPPGSGINIPDSQHRLQCYGTLCQLRIGSWLFGESGFESRCRFYLLKQFCLQVTGFRLGNWDS